jgi:NADH-quinone oxidoreductase subunit L
MASALEEVTRVPVRLALLLAAGLDRLEQGLDASVRGVVGTAVGLARIANRAEGRLDLAARGLGRLTMDTAHATDLAEISGFGRGIDQGARGVRRAGGRLRRLQSGKLYLYTLSVFVWVLLAGLLVVLVWG